MVRICDGVSDFRHDLNSFEEPSGVTVANLFWDWLGPAKYEAYGRRRARCGRVKGRICLTLTVKSLVMV